MNITFVHHRFITVFIKPVYFATAIKTNVLNQLKGMSSPASVDVRRFKTITDLTVNFSTTIQGEIYLLRNNTGRFKALTTVSILYRHRHDPQIPKKGSFQQEVSI